MKIIAIKGKIELLSGLHIGGGDDTMKIGGIDNGVIKDVNTDKPYIPGSSLKGKIRSLLEWDLGFVGIGDGSPFNSKLLYEDPIFQNENKKRDGETLLKLFGNGKIDPKFAEITRVSFGDCPLVEVEDQKVSEAKYENVIDRRDGTAKHPRQTERVPAGVKFDFDIRIKVINGEDETEFISMIKRGISLLENDYLGGSGSRGYGRVKFHIEEPSK